MTSKKTGVSTTGRPAAKSKLKAQAFSLHIGLNTVSAAAYGGWTGPLAACEFDANDMAAIAHTQGMKTTILLGKKGTRAKVLVAMRNAARRIMGPGSGAFPGALHHSNSCLESCTVYRTWIGYSLDTDRLIGSSFNSIA